MERYTSISKIVLKNRGAQQGYSTRSKRARLWRACVPMAQCGKGPPGAVLPTPFRQGTTRKEPLSLNSSRVHELPADEAAVYRRLDAERLPHHVAIIMDGNGRWAGKRSVFAPPRATPMQTARHRNGAPSIS